MEFDQRHYDFDERPVPDRLAELSLSGDGFGFAFHPGNFETLSAVTERIKMSYGRFMKNENSEGELRWIPDSKAMERLTDVSAAICRETAHHSIPPDLNIQNESLSREEILRYSSNPVLTYTVREKDTIMCRALKRIMEDENLLRRFLLPMNSGLALQDTYRLAMQILQDPETATEFCEDVFRSSGYPDIQNLIGEDKDIALYLVLQKYAEAYFRTKHAVLIFRKIKRILGKFFPDLVESATIKFLCEPRDPKRESGFGLKTGNNGNLERHGPNNFQIRILHGLQLSLDDTKNNVNETLQYSGIEYDFVTILHEYLHALFDQLVDPNEKIKRTDAYGDASYGSLSEGFATFGEMLLLRAMIQGEDHLGLGAQAQTNVFEAVLATRLEFLTQARHYIGQYKDGVKMMDYLFWKYGEKALDAIKMIDATKATQIKITDSIYEDALNNSNFGPLFSAISA